MSESDEADEIIAHLNDLRAGMRARLAAWEDDVDMMAIDIPVLPYSVAAARFDVDGDLVDFHIDPNALTNYTHVQLQHIVSDVLNTTRERTAARGKTLQEFVRYHLDEMCGHTAQLDSDTAEAKVRTYAESSRDGMLALALDHAGCVLWCRLEPQVNEWATDVLADRIKHLYTLALMRGRCDHRLHLERRLGPKLTAELFSRATGSACADKNAVKRYRQHHIDF